MLVAGAAHQDVGETQGAGRDPYCDLSRTGLGVRDLDKTHDLCRGTEGLDVPGSHSDAPVVFTWWTASCTSARVVRNALTGWVVSAWPNETVQTMCWSSGDPPQLGANDVGVERDGTLGDRAQAKLLRSQEQRRNVGSAVDGAYTPSSAADVMTAVWGAPEEVEVACHLRVSAFAVGTLDAQCRVQAVARFPRRSARTPV